MVHAAARTLGVDARGCAVVGDIGADVEAARGAGARSVLVPTPQTRADRGARRPLRGSGPRRTLSGILLGAQP